MKSIFTLILLGITTLCIGAEFEPNAPNLSPIRIVPVTPTPQAEHVQIYLSYPQNDQLVRKTPIQLNIRLNGYPIGNESSFERRKQIYNDHMGQSVRVIIDEYPHFSIYESFVDTLDDNNIYYEQILTQNIPFSLKPGLHVIRTFPVRSYGESLKEKECFQASTFYYQNRSTDGLKIDLNGPLLTYNEPEGDYPYSPNRPLLLDFYISNVVLSKDGYKVRIIIDDTIKRILNAWMPFYIYGLSKGTHKIRLQLLDPQNKKVPGIFNDVEKQVTLRP